MTQAGRAPPAAGQAKLGGDGSALEALARRSAGLLDTIAEFCRLKSMAESTFGRLAVNDGKFVSRLRDGARITPETLERVSGFMARHGVTAPLNPPELMPLLRVDGKPAPAPAPSAEPAAAPAPETSERTFRFFDNRQKYLLFVNTCSEKEVIARRVGMELAHLHPEPPALRVFDAGLGDGTVLTRVMREMHRRFATVPFYIVGKEISLEDVRLSLDKMADRFFEHPATVLIVTNMYYTEAPWLQPKSVTAAQALDDLPPARSKTAGNKVIIEAVDSVAEALGNTRAVCRKCYIHPAVFDAYLSGMTLSRVEPARAKAMKGLLDAEARLVTLLQRTNRKAKAAKAA